MEGFLVMDYASQFKTALGTLAGWIQEGKLKPVETVVEGFDKIPEYLQFLFMGKNIGKLLVRVSEEPPASSGAAKL
jgi:NADPH-dependent curcumin reductase CurA